MEDERVGAMISALDSVDEEDLLRPVKPTVYRSRASVQSAVQYWTATINDNSISVTDRSMWNLDALTSVMSSCEEQVLKDRLNQRCIGTSVDATSVSYMGLQ